MYQIYMKRPSLDHTICALSCLSTLLDDKIPIFMQKQQQQPQQKNIHHDAISCFTQFHLLSTCSYVHVNKCARCMWKGGSIHFQKKKKKSIDTYRLAQSELADLRPRVLLSVTYLNVSFLQIQYNLHSETTQWK